MLDKEERAIADKGYTDDMALTPDTISSPKPSSLHSALRARHETVNKRLKQFAVCNSKFRHALSYHGTCFHAVSRITQLALLEEPLFDVLF